MTHDELIDALKAVSWPGLHAGMSSSRALETAPPGAVESALVDEATRQLVEEPIETRLALIRRWVAEIPPPVLFVLNNEMVIAKGEAVGNALQALYFREGIVAIAIEHHKKETST